MSAEKILERLCGSTTGQHVVKSDQQITFTHFVRHSLTYGTPDDIIFIARRSDGVIVFLEKGTAESGLQHILKRHAADFINRGIPKNQIANSIRRAVLNGTKVGTKGSGKNVRTIYEVIINGKKQRIAVGVADNGYIVTAFPASL